MLPICLARERNHAEAWQVVQLCRAKQNPMHLLSALVPFSCFRLLVPPISWCPAWDPQEINLLSPQEGEGFHKGLLGPVSYSQCPVPSCITCFLLVDVLCGGIKRVFWGGVECEIFVPGASLLLGLTIAIRYSNWEKTL